MHQEQLLDPDDPEAGSLTDDALPVRVVRSRRRKKTSAARIIDGFIEVRIPAWLPNGQANATVADLVDRVRRASDLANRGAELEARAHRLAEQFGLPSPSSIRWVGNQSRRWGSCTPATGEIRISSRLRRVPDYVLDYVVVHELAHLVEPGHDAAFRDLEARFPQCERAEGFLEAMGFGLAAGRHQAD